jgi:hypothetical protein
MKDRLSRARDFSDLCRDFGQLLCEIFHEVPGKGSGATNRALSSKIAADLHLF